MSTTGHSDSAQTYALVGWPLAHSLSPVMHNAAFAAAGITAQYSALPTEPTHLARVVDDVRSGVLAGANITVPHKVTVRSMLDAVSSVVAATGAANTIVHTATGLRGENTDVAGFRHALKMADVAECDSRRSVVLGAGGASRAVVFALLHAGWRVTVLNRSSGTLGALAGTIHRVFDRPRLTTAPLSPARLTECTRDAQLLVNATPVGSDTSADDSPWPMSVSVPAHLTVIDVVAWPPETRFVQKAREDGAAAHGGLEMLIGQAAASWALWTGQPAPITVMRAAAREAIAAFDDTV